MNYNLKTIITQKINIYHLIIILIVLLIPIFTYPRIYGVDAFQVIWMANALKNGAFFSENTWLIHPLSYFGYYPFSNRAIGIPFVLAFLITFIEIITFGMFGLTEAILLYDIIIILIMYKVSKSLANTLFKEKWSKIMFIAAILFSPNFIWDVTMTVSTRIIITILIMILLNVFLKLLDKSINKYKAITIIALSLLVGLFTHKLWILLIITIPFYIITVIIQKFPYLQKRILIFYLPLCVICFFLGALIFEIDPRKITSPFFDNSTLLGLITNLSINYLVQVGLIILFLPIGIMVIIIELVKILKNPEINQYKSEDIPEGNTQKKIYLLIFIVGFSFMASSFYAVILFIPIIIIFCIYGLIFFKNYITKNFIKLNWLFPLILLGLSSFYTIFYIRLYININLIFMELLLFFSLLLYIFPFLLKFYKKTAINLNIKVLNNRIHYIIIISSILIFSSTSILGKLRVSDNSPFPWENLYLTDEEIQIIDFFQDEEIDGLIFSPVYIASRINAIGFLPTFRWDDAFARDLYYGFITPNEVYENTRILISAKFLVYFLYYDKEAPVRLFTLEIINYNISIFEDLSLLKTKNKVQYVISIKDEYISHSTSLYINYFAESPLLQSISKELTPVFSTQHLLVWKIY